ncbi:FRG domain-containing protein [Anaerobacillus alkaliphilus]|uniref:FRG domain-containing protein n=1 Tax=Anaerobacillus alkaliphilus TaxID=1548597 RepID=A0A4Q0VUX9_9BACI|nr:FRG domain-containing protein [Anaerobacillus alkaliphilus]RXJ02243.1 FRG domain-containing protein [Anaerobacillus alkaliphilus]
MGVLEYAIFRDVDISSKSVKEHSDYYTYIYETYRKDIKDIKENYTIDIIEKSLLIQYSGDEFVKVRENIVYLIDGLEMMEGEPEANDDKINFDIKEIDYLSLKEIIQLIPQSEDNQLKVDLNQLYDKVVNNEWSESVVEQTLAEKYLIEDKSNITLINSLGDYTRFIHELESKSVNSYVSRGQKDCSYELVPSIYRIYEKKQDVHAKGYEHTFRQKIAHYEKGTEERSIEELRAEGQHYGLPTEYLDFTEAHIISLLFAIEDYKYTRNHSIVFFVDSTAFNKETIGREEKLINLQDASERNYLKDYISCSYFIKVPNINERIHFQKGCFLRLSSHDYMGNPDFLSDLKDKVAIAVINKNCKEDILKELFSLGINFESIYPDKDNLVKSIRFNYEVILEGGKLK